MDAIILCGGYGTRLKKISKGIPKPLIVVNEVPFVQYLINNLVKNGISNIYLATSYKSFLFENLFKNNSNIHVVKEQVKVGTGGAIINCLLKKKVTKNLLVLNGDSYNIYNHKKFLEFHKKKKSKFSILVKIGKKYKDSGNIIISKKSQIKLFVEKKKQITNDLFLTLEFILFQKIFF